MKEKKIAFIGCGNMAQALIGGLVDDGYNASNIFVSDINQQTLDKVQQQYHVQTSADKQKSIEQADIVVLSVKPTQIKTVLQEMEIPKNSLFLSIAAGILLKDLDNWSKQRHAIVRCMPNTPALVRSGAAGLFANERTSEEQKELAESILRAVGVTVWLDREEQINAVTALSGSGPAYYFLFMEAMIEAGQKLGLTQQQAQLLSIQTAFGASKMALESTLTPAILRENVTSKNGTTEKALAQFNNAKLKQTVLQAMQAAHDRSIEIAKELGE